MPVFRPPFRLNRSVRLAAVAVLALPALLASGAAMGAGAAPPAAAAPARPDLHEPVPVPEHMAYVWWQWPDGFRTLETDFTIHNDVGDFSDEYGLYLMLGYGEISGDSFYFGIQTDVQGKGKGAIFSRWGTRDLDYARYSESGGWAQSSDHEGDFIGVRRSYDWGAGDYRARLAPDGTDPDGTWFGLWLTDLANGETAWVGSLKFRHIEGTAEADGRGYSTMEIYGRKGEIRPIDIPQWLVSLKLPRADGAPPGKASTGYSMFSGKLPNSDIRYDEASRSLRIQAGGATERTTDPVEIHFE